jgi:hypothetical protein
VALFESHISTDVNGGRLILKKLIWTVVGFGIAIWSGLAWLAYNVVGWGGNIASSNADIVTPHPETVEWLSWLALFGIGVGEWIILIVWGIGVAIALGIGALGSRFAPRLSNLKQSIRNI